jgi:hypothetical protein
LPIYKETLIFVPKYNIQMIATIELPNNKAEWTFLLEVLKRLNVPIKLIDAAPDATIETDVLEEHARILEERYAAMNAPDAKFFTWDEAQQILANRKRQKTTI